MSREKERMTRETKELMRDKGMRENMDERNKWDKRIKEGCKKQRNERNKE